jgi:hypothetical protein
MNRPLIDEEIAALLPPLTPEEYAELEMKVSVEGFRDRLVVWKETGILLDGHNRLKICEKYGIEYTVIEMGFPDRERAIQWVIDNQLGRRNLTDERRAYYRGKEYLSKKQQHVGQTVSDGQNVHPGQTVATALGEKHGVDEKTIRRDAAFAQAVDKIGEADPEQKDAILSGNTGQTKQEVIQSVRPPAQAKKAPARTQGSPYPAERRCRDCRHHGLSKPHCRTCDARNAPAKRQPGDETGNIRRKPPKQGKPIFEWKTFETPFGQVTRSIDDFGHAYGCKETRETNDIRQMLGKVLEAFKQLYQQKRKESS